MVRGWGWGLASAPSVVVGARGADFAAFACFLGVVGLILFMFAWFCLFFGLGGAVPRPLCGSGPPLGLIGFVDFFLESPLESVILGPFP